MQQDLFDYIKYIASSLNRKSRQILFFIFCKNFELLDGQAVKYLN